MLVQLPEKYTEFSHMPAHVGIQKFGEEAISAMLTEYMQLDQGAVEGNPVIELIDPSVITAEQKQQAMNAVNHINDKKATLQVKGRTCADGSKQCQYLKEDESLASPTVLLESILSTLVIDIYEDRDVAICDVPGAFSQAEITDDKTVLMRITGRFVDILCQANEKYTKYIIHENGCKVVYVRVLCAIYGCIES